ncbi:AAA family ATPase [Shewanella putrefaciens]|uniref:AAA family ATPase n=1 Tax=Shewanella putrefaciens TaxID=24 RepID=UPI003D795D59
MNDHFRDKMQITADRARKMLNTMSDSISKHKIEFGLDTFHQRYSKGALANLRGLTRKIVEKSINEMEAAGYKFDKKLNGSVEVYDLTVEQVIDIYKHRGHKALREKFERGYVVFLCNLKGGVSKTVSTVNIAQALRCHSEMLQHDLKVLVLDIDPQSSASMFMSHKNSIGTIDNTVVQAVFQDLTREELLDEFVIPTQVPGVDIIPSSIADAFIASQWEALCVQRFGSDINPFEALSRNVCEKLINDYDFIFIDCGPHLDSLLKSALCAADVLVTPLPPSTVDLHSTLQYVTRIPEMLDHLEAEGAATNLKGHLAFMSKYSQSEQDINSSMIANAVFAEDMMMASIPELSAFKRCAETFDTVVSVHPGSYTGDSKALKKARESLDQFTLALFQHISRIRGSEYGF